MRWNFFTNIYVAVSTAVMQYRTLRSEFTETEDDCTVIAHTHYCHNCGWHAFLPDGVHCQFCLNFFYANRRLPTRQDGRRAQQGVLNHA